MPDAGGHGQEALTDAGAETVSAAPSVLFEAELAFERVASIHWRMRSRRHIAQMPPFRRTTGPTTRRHIRGGLRAALNDAITQQIITFNPAADVELEPINGPRA